MADLMGQHAEDHLGIFAREFHEFVGKDQCSVRQGEGVRTERAASAEVERIARLSPCGLRRDAAEPFHDPVAPRLVELRLVQQGPVHRLQGARRHDLRHDRRRDGDGNLHQQGQCRAINQRAKQDRGSDEGDQPRMEALQPVDRSLACATFPG